MSMKTIALTAISLLATQTLAQTVETCSNNLDPHFNDGTKDTFETNIRLWHESFGGGGGWLGKPDGGYASTYQAVCCSGWCLYAENSSGTSQSWNDDEFNSAVETLRDDLDGSGASQCRVQLGNANVGLDPYLMLYFSNGNYETTDATCDGEYHTLYDAFGDTCATPGGYNGPSC